MPQFMLHSDFQRFAHDPFLYGYLEALFFTADSEEIGKDGGEVVVSDLAPEFRLRCAADCAGFRAKAGDSLHGLGGVHAGRDFLLTRCETGAGFEDGHWGSMGERLAAIARTFPPVHVYKGDDGLLHIFAG